MKGRSFFLPVLGKGICIFRSDDHDLGFLLCEFVIVLAQLRHVPPAERSDKAAVEDQQDVLLALKICQADCASVEIGQCKVRGGLVKFGAAHEDNTRIMEFPSRAL